MGYRFLVLRTLLALMLGGLSPTMLIAAQEEGPVAQDEQPVDELLMEEQPVEEQFSEEKVLPKSTEARYEDELDLFFPQSQNLFVAASDKFGYTWSELAGAPWEDITGHGALTFNSWDDGYAGPVPIGFSFRYYEKAYTQLYVSMNGLVSFENEVSEPTNQLLPYDIKPNNLIAPLWMDLFHPCPKSPTPCSSKVFSKQESNPARFVIQWTEVVPFFSKDNSEKQTFQVVLYETGDIEFRYKTITGKLGDYTIGIEDRDGADGLTYSYNGAPAGISSGSAVLFTRPAKMHRVKITPLHQSRFVVKRQASINLAIHNTGDIAAQDIFNIQVVPTDPNWKISLFRADGVTPLTDTNGDGQIDTGPLAYGGSLGLVLRFRAPAYASSGDTFPFQLRATSSLAPGIQTEIPIQFAIPAPFAQTVSDNVSGMWLDTIWENSWRHTKVSNIFTGNTMSVSGLGKGSYVYLWERNGYNTATNANYTNIEYVVLNQTANLIKGVQRLTKTELDASNTIRVDARYPSVATTPDGRFGIVWTETRLTTDQRLINIYFAVMDGLGQVVSGPTNITGSTNWIDTSQPSLYSSPVIAATSDNRFILSWLKTTDERADVYASVYSSSGGVQRSPWVLLSETGTKPKMYHPVVIGMTNNRVFTAVTVVKNQEEIYRIYYGFFDSGGNPLKGFTEVPDSNGWKSDAVQVSTGNIVLAWTNPFNDNIAVTAFHGTAYGIVKPPYELPRIGSRLSDYVSITRDLEGRAVLTWMSKLNDYLFYALVDGEAGIVTPPMIFATGAAEKPLIQTSFASHGNAPYLGAWDVSLPSLMR
jgi:hypothetical protein